MKNQMVLKTYFFEKYVKRPYFSSNFKKLYFILSNFCSDLVKKIHTSLKEIANHF